MPAKLKHPYNFPPKEPAWVKLLTPTSAGMVTAATLAAAPSLGLPLLGDKALALARVADFLPERLDILPRRIYVAVLGFALGYTGAKCLDWLRWRALKRLFLYKGWVYSPKAFKTKLWALLVKFLEGPGAMPTYAMQGILPKLPLPDLDQTLDRWLNASSQLVPRDEFEATKEAVEEFRKNEGPRLQAYLKQKAKKTQSWLADYWISAAYLSNRDSLAGNSNYFITCGFTNARPVPDQLTRATVWIRNIAKFNVHLEKNEVPPFMIQDMLPLCMNGYRFMFGTVRVPGEHMDTVSKYEDKHIVVIRKGHFFKVEMHVPARKGKGKRLLTYRELRNQLKDICDQADAMEDAPCVAALTAQSRPVWAKQREILARRNADALRAVESAMFMACLDTDSPKDVHEFMSMVLMGSGTGNDRWFDKVFTNVTFSNSMNGLNVEHTLLDATVFGTLVESVALHEWYEDGDFVTRDTPAELEAPKVLNWDTSDLEAEIKEATIQCQKRSADLDTYMHYCIYGKGFMKRKGVSPDGFIQMVMQLAYYRQHKEIPKTYEPSTHRLYLLGRTETVHPGSATSSAWIRSMDDPTSTKQTRAELFRKSVKYQSEFRLAATVGQGCDRHLLGLYCASRELGMDIPKVFIDQSWRKSFKLSTSQTPTLTYEYGTPVDFKYAVGGFGPGCQDGYGVSYVIMGEDMINMAISSWKSAEDTDSERFATSVQQAMEDVKEMLS